MRRVVQAGSRLLSASSVLRASAQPGLSTNSRLYSGETITCTLFPGDGIGPEIADAVKLIFEAAKAPIDWDEQFIGKVADPRTNSMVTRENLDSVLVRCSFRLTVYHTVMAKGRSNFALEKLWLTTCRATAEHTPRGGL